MPARWRLLDGLEIMHGGKPYLNRLRIIETPWFGAYLHRIHEPDLARDAHDHPWWFASLTLSGGYTETVLPVKQMYMPVPVRRVHKRWTFTTMSRKSAHRITSVDGELWTLVFTGPHRDSWGFWTAKGFVPWRAYFGQPGGQRDGLASEERALWG